MVAVVSREPANDPLHVTSAYTKGNRGRTGWCLALGEVRSRSGEHKVKNNIRWTPETKCLPPEILGRARRRRFGITAIAEHENDDNDNNYCKKKTTIK